MNIVFFTPTMQFGGYERVVLSFANRIAETSAANVSIVCGYSSGDLRSQISQKIDVIELKCRTRTLLFKLIKYFNSHQPDVFYSGFRIYNSIAILAKRIAGNTTTQIYISQHGFEYQSIYKKIINGIIQKQADGFIAVTESLRLFEQGELRLTCPSCVIGNPVVSSDLVINPIDDEWFDDQIPVICVCSRLSADKNVDLAIHILQKLREKLYDVKMLILGDGPELCHLRTKADEYSLTSYIRFQGFVKDPIDYMAKCSVYLHTCDREGFGNTVVEALYAELPIVTTDCGGPVDIIENNKYGISFGNGRDIEAAKRGADAIITVIENKHKFTNLRERAMSYSVENAVSKFMKFISGEN